MLWLWKIYKLRCAHRSTTLFNESDDLCPWGGRNGLGFPALERLTLDFSEWALTDHEGLLVTDS